MNERDVVAGFEAETMLKAAADAEVWKARRLADGAFAALKVAKAGTVAAKRLEHEATVLVRVGSPRCVGLLLATEAAGFYVLALEWCGGGSLKDRLAGGFGGGRAARTVFAGLVRAVYDLHRKGVVHRDVKPSNVFFTAADELRLGDFGIALVPETEVRGGRVAGTPGWMAPEQEKGLEATEKSDVYAIGRVTLAVLGENGAEEAAFRRRLADLTAENPRLRPDVVRLLGEII